MKQTVDSDISENVIFEGHQDNVEKYIQRTKAFIMTSEYEGLPMVLIEALGYGIPCIVPDISNIPEIAIRNYNSILVESLDTVGFADAIHKILSDNDLYSELKKGAENFRMEHEYEYSSIAITKLWESIPELFR